MSFRPEFGEVDPVAAVVEALIKAKKAADDADRMFGIDPSGRKAVVEVGGREVAVIEGSEVGVAPEVARTVKPFIEGAENGTEVLFKMIQPSGEATTVFRGLTWNKRLYLDAADFLERGAPFI